MKRKHLYLSPHLDDAVLSCGGLIRKQTLAKETVVVVTIFAGIPPYERFSAYAERLHAVWGCPGGPVEVRRQEDESALRLLGAEYLHLDYLDAMYRQDSRSRSWLYESTEAVFGPVHEDDLPLIVGLAQALESMILSNPDARLYAPLAVGGHVDHQIVHRIAKTLIRKRNRVTFYEDYPYAGEPGAYSKVLSSIGERARPVLVDVSQGLEDRIRAIGLYSSQMPRIFGSEGGMRSKVRAFAFSLGSKRGPCERYWVGML